MPQFAERVELARAYYDKFYSKTSNRLVFCGINPRQSGSGKTGLPFIDFNGINQLMSGKYKDVQERSAQFMLSIINKYEIGEFQNAVYMTNLSWYGFRRDGKNMNYYNLPRAIRDLFIESFIEEMKIVQPTAIVPLSGEVERKLKKLAADDQLDFPIAERLPHPFNCSFPTNVEKARERYHKCIEQHTGLQI
ncbi:uracil-DNA glycosylase family protein [Sporosarcina aquimarina]|nr:uracil-DNA glycosylase family protein [Sporosarcina aquimarina]